MTKEEEFRRTGEVFYWCDPEKAETCRKTTCHINGGNCWLTLRPDWGSRLVTSDGCKKDKIESEDYI